MNRTAWLSSAKATGLASACLEGNQRAWESLFAAKAGRSDCLLMDALRALDREASEHYRAPPRYRRLLENRIPGMFGRKSNNRGTSGHGQPLN